jgi:hypothetical protein
MNVSGKRTNDEKKKRTAALATTLHYFFTPTTKISYERTHYFLAIIKQVAFSFKRTQFITSVPQIQNGSQF